MCGSSKKSEKYSLCLMAEERESRVGLRIATVCSGFEPCLRSHNEVKQVSQETRAGVQRQVLGVYIQVDY